MSLNLPEAVDEILSLAMEGNIKWDFPDVIMYRERIREIESIAKSPLGFYTPHKKRAATKELKKLRRKIRIINWKNASRFAANIKIKAEDNWVIGRRCLQEFIVEVEFFNDDIKVFLHRPFGRWNEDENPRRGIRGVRDYTISSETYPKIMMLPTFIRLKDAVNLPEESNYGKEDC